MKKRRILALSLALGLTLSAAASAATYTVTKDDVLWKIAKTHGTTWQELAKVNNLKDPNFIYVGQVLQLGEITGGGEPAAPTGYKDGKYTGTGKGFGGNLSVEVTISGGKISAVKVGSNKETAGIGTPAIEKLPSAIVKANSANVSTVAGATMTSKAIISAAKAAIAKAEVVEPAPTPTPTPEPTPTPTPEPENPASANSVGLKTINATVKGLSKDIVVAANASEGVITYVKATVDGKVLYAGDADVSAVADSIVAAGITNNGKAITKDEASAEITKVLTANGFKLK